MPVTDGGRFPIYLLLDTSSSMETQAANLKDAFKTLLDTLLDDAQLKEMGAALSVFSFDTVCRELIPLKRISIIQEDIEIKPEGVTCLADALTVITEKMQAELHFESKDGFSRDKYPLLFIVTDGIPTDADGYYKPEIESKLIDIKNRIQENRCWGGIVAIPAFGHLSREWQEIGEKCVKIITRHIQYYSDFNQNTIRDCFKFISDTIKATSEIASKSQQTPNRFDPLGLDQVIPSLQNGPGASQLANNNVQKSDWQDVD